MEDDLNKLIDYAFELNDLLYSIPKDFKEALKIFIEKSNKSLSKLSEEAGFSRNYLYEVLNNDKDITKKGLVAICIAFKRPFLETEELFKLKGYAFGYSLEDNIYKIILTNYYNKNIDEINEWLEKNGFERLTKDKYK